jgi:thiol-disulfide isomerase/thioredoxin
MRDLRWCVAVGWGCMSLLGATIVVAAGPAAPSSPAGEAQAAPAATASAEVTLSVKNWEETQKLIAEHRGKIVVLDAWSTSCVPCVREFPHLVALHREMSQDVVCISLNCDYIGVKSKPPEFYRERVLKFLTKHNATFPNILCSEPSDELFEKLSIPSIPAVLVYGTDGQLLKTFDNSEAETDEDGFTYKDVRALVDQLIATAKKQ